MAKRYVFIINGNTSAYKKRQLEEAMSRIDEDLKVRIEMRFTEYPGHAASIASEVSDQYGDRVVIVACGGDGTVHEISNALAFKKTPMVCLPFGTGNDFAKSVYGRDNAKNLANILSRLDEMHTIQIDLIRIDSYDVLGNPLGVWSGYSNNVASIGLDTKVQAAAKAYCNAKPESKFRRKFAYPMMALKLVMKNRSDMFTYKLELENGETIESDEKEKVLISICNGRFYGSGFMPAPDALLNDGVLDVCVVDNCSFWKALNLLTKYKHGKHTKSEGVKMFRATSGIITGKNSSFQLMGNYDGEDFFGNRIRFEVFQNALNLNVFVE